MKISKEVTYKLELNNHDCEILRVVASCANRFLDNTKGKETDIITCYGYPVEDIRNIIDALRSLDPRGEVKI